MCKLVYAIIHKEYTKGYNMIIDKKVLVKILAKRTLEHYIAKGYTAEIGDEIEVSSLDLTKASRVLVTRKCENCGDEKELPFLKAHGKLCKRCATVKANRDRIDTKLTICECGNPKAYNSVNCYECYMKIDKTGVNSATYGVKNPELAERNKNRKPEEHWNWKGGNSKNRSGKQIAWALAVKEASNNLCDCCGYSRKIALEAHHYVFSEGKHKNDFVVDNGVSLCTNCHKEFHKKNGYGNNTKEQYIKFKESYND